MSGAGEDGPRTRWLHVDGRATRLLEQGSGRPVVLVHGLGLSAGVWEPHLERLSRAGYRALAPDLPGFGQSDGPMTGLSVPATARWLLGLADTLGLSSAAWVGHSVGTQQVLQLAATAPDRAAAVVLAAPTGRAGWHLVHHPAGLLATAFQEPPGLVASIVRRYLRSPLTTLSTWIRSMRHVAALDAPRVSCPTLLVLGERDAVVSEPFVARLERLLPDAETCSIRGASHAVAINPVEPFTDALLDFFRRRYPA